jgi:hypothetical protein
MDGKAPSAKSGRTQGRWVCDDKEEQAETWYNLTATEIAVIQHPEYRRTIDWETDDTTG